MRDSMNLTHAGCSKCSLQALIHCLRSPESLRAHSRFPNAPTTDGIRESFGRLNSVTPQFALCSFHPDKERKLGDSGDRRPDGRGCPKRFSPSLLPFRRRHLMGLDSCKHLRTRTMMTQYDRAAGRVGDMNGLPCPCLTTLIPFHIPSGRPAL